MLWHHGTRQQGWHISGTLRKQFPYFTVQFILSLSKFPPLPSIPAIYPLWKFLSLSLSLCPSVYLPSSLCGLSISGNCSPPNEQIAIQREERDPGQKDANLASREPLLFSLLEILWAQTTLDMGCKKMCQRSSGHST